MHLKQPHITGMVFSTFSDDINGSLIKPNGFRFTGFGFGEIEGSVVKIEIGVFEAEQIADTQTQIHAHFPDVGINLPKLVIQQRMNESNLFFIGGVNDVHICNSYY
jgi:hypothetical protein